MTLEDEIRKALELLEDHPSEHGIVIYHDESQGFKSLPVQIGSPLVVPESAYRTGKYIEIRGWDSTAYLEDGEDDDEARFNARSDLFTDLLDEYEAKFTHILALEGDISNG